MRAFTVRSAAWALSVDAKWLDNLLSHHAVPGVTRKSRGVTRRIEPDGLRLIAAAVILMNELGASARRSIELAATLLSSDGAIDSPLLAVRLDLPALDDHLRRRLIDAIESAPSPRRGRPPAIAHEVS